MTHGSLFSGIGGFDLAAEWMGWDNIFHCEINEFCNNVLKYYWPHAKSYTDIKETDFNVWRGKVDIISGGFPCQPYSQAGKRKGKADDRHLWPQMLRAIKEIQPRWVVGENVSGLLNWSRGMVLDEIKADLEAAGFEVLPPLVLPACAVNAPHRRDRVWIVAHATGSGTGASSERCNESRKLFQKDKRDENKQFDKSVSKSGITTNANSKRINGQHEVNTNEGRFNALNDTKQSVTADTEGNRINREKELENNKRQSGKRRRCNIDNVGKIPDKNRDGDATDTERIGQSGQREHQQPINSKENRDGQANWSDRTHEINDWTTWPTQPPLCSRNDGLSSELAGITISKHRTESIKAYGNSVVPQIVHEIFKTIEQYEKENK